MFEWFIHRHIYSYLVCNTFLSQSSSGFWQKRSTVTSLLDTTQKLCSTYDGGLSSRIFFINISKAFDRVIHSGLQQIGISTSLLYVLFSYLSGRSEIVRINDSYSPVCYADCELPQGPLLFLVYVNDIIEPTEFSISLLADNTAYYFLLIAHSTSIKI